MTREARREDDPCADVRATAERIGHARCEVEYADRELEALRRQRERLARDIDAVRAENGTLEQELLRELAAWRKLDGDKQRLQDVLPRVRQVTASMSYRFVDAALRALQQVLRALRLRRA